MKKLDIFEDYLADTVSDGAYDMGDIGSLVALAILEAGDDLPAAAAALEKAKSAFRVASTAKEAAEIFDSAIHHLDNWIV